MKKIFSCALLAVLTACVGATPASHPELITFISQDSGIKGSYNTASYKTDHVRVRIGPLACASGAIASYGESDAEGGVVQFTAMCSGANKYEDTAGFTLNDIQKAGHITASVDGQLVQIKL